MLREEMKKMKANTIPIKLKEKEGNVSSDEGLENMRKEVLKLKKPMMNNWKKGDERHNKREEMMMEKTR